MKKAGIIVTGVLFGLLRGMEQGMIMSRAGDAFHAGAIPGVRGHVGFGYYHAVDTLVVVLFCVLVLELLWRRPRWMFIAGLAFLVWEATELGYNFSRYSILVPGYEHIDFMDLLSIELHGWKVYMLHYIRAVTSISLLIAGGVE